MIVLYRSLLLSKNDSELFIYWKQVVFSSSQVVITSKKNPTYFTIKHWFSENWNHFPNLAVCSVSMILFLMKMKNVVHQTNFILKMIVLKFFQIIKKKSFKKEAKCLSFPNIFIKQKKRIIFQKPLNSFKCELKRINVSIWIKFILFKGYLFRRKFMRRVWSLKL